MDEIDKIFGPRVMVELEEVRDEVTERAKAAGLSVVRDPRNTPKSTVGKIVALGTDPLIQDYGLQLGDRILFAPNAGYRTNIGGKEFKTLELQEITSKLK